MQQVIKTDPKIFINVFRIYANTEIGEKLGYEYMYKYMDTLRFQLQKGGIRLAKVLNEIFS